jgi:hypothetical protein
MWKKFNSHRCDEKSQLRRFCGMLGKISATYTRGRVRTRNPYSEAHLACRCAIRVDGVHTSPGCAINVRILSASRMLRNYTR